MSLPTEFCLRMERLLGPETPGVSSKRRWFGFGRQPIKWRIPYYRMRNKLSARGE